MTIKIISTYTNVDEKWLDWWFKHLVNEEVMPGSTVIVEELKESGYAVFTSKDPSSPVVASTEYRVDPGDGREYFKGRCDRL